MKQVFIPYYEWEDFKNGMWDKGHESQLNDAIEFTSDHIKYGAAMGEVIIKWPKTMLNSLTNTSINRLAFLGHCAVCYKLNIPESITRQAWGLLTETQRVNANKIALYHIKKWELNYAESNRKIYKGLGKQMLFEWYP